MSERDCNANSLRRRCSGCDGILEHADFVFTGPRYTTVLCQFCTHHNGLDGVAVGKKVMREFEPEAWRHPDLGPLFTGPDPRDLVWLDGHDTNQRLRGAYDREEMGVGIVYPLMPSILVHRQTPTEIYRFPILVKIAWWYRDRDRDSETPDIQIPHHQPDLLAQLAQVGLATHRVNQALLSVEKLEKDWELAESTSYSYDKPPQRVVF